MTVCLLQAYCFSVLSVNIMQNALFAVLKRTKMRLRKINWSSLQSSLFQTVLLD